jgi:hypothetical protein
MKRKITFGVMLSAAIVATRYSCVAAGAIAIGVPADVARDSISIWTAVKEAATDQATEKALAGCKAVGSNASKALCKIVATYSNQCAAAAFDLQSVTPGWGWAIADNSMAAKKQAMTNCHAMTGSAGRDACEVVSNGDWCDGLAK